MNYIEKNKVWFKNNKFYHNFILENETYKNIKDGLDNEVKGIKCLLDIGNGGLFNYDITLADEIFAVDLFFENTIEDFGGKKINLRKGSALSLPFENSSFDGIIIVSLLHHLVGEKFSDITRNIEICFSECFRVLKTNGKIIINEPVIPSWFFLMEKVFYRAIKFGVNVFIRHPFAVQITRNTLSGILSKKFKIQKNMETRKKGMLIHFGVKFPAFISPVKAVLLVAEKTL